MNQTPNRQRDDDRSSWLRTLYQIAHSDTRWAKEQGWRVVNWSLLLFAALLAVSKYVLAEVSWIAFGVIAVLVVVVAIIFLLDLSQFGAGTRRTSSQIQKEIPDASEILDQRSGDRDQTFYLTIQIVVLIVALALTWLALAFVG